MYQALGSPYTLHLKFLGSTNKKHDSIPLSTHLMWMGGLKLLSYHILTVGRIPYHQNTLISAANYSQQH